jgi:hypothetical protein
MMAMDGHGWPSVPIGRHGGPFGSVMPQLKVNLPADLDLRLRAFCVAMRGADMGTIARQGIETVIDHDLATNPGLRRRYEEALNELQRKRGVRPLHVVAKTGTAQADTD